MSKPVFIACAHGTRDAAGQAAVHLLRSDIARLRTELDVREAYVDVQAPALAEVLSGLLTGRRAVVVPLLLSRGVHINVDIPRAVSERPHTVAAEPLGPDDRLAQLLEIRLQEAAVHPQTPVILAAAGSSDPAGTQDVEAMAAALASRRRGTVTLAYGAGARPRLSEAVAAAGPDAVVVSYLLAPGFFQDQLARSGAGIITAPLLPADVLVELALQRFDAALHKFR